MGSVGRKDVLHGYLRDLPPVKDTLPGLLLDVEQRETGVQALCNRPAQVGGMTCLRREIHRDQHTLYHAGQGADCGRYGKHRPRNTSEDPLYSAPQRCRGAVVMGTGTHQGEPNWVLGGVVEDAGYGVGAASNEGLCADALSACHLCEPAEMIHGCCFLMETVVVETWKFWKKRVRLGSDDHMQQVEIGLEQGG